MAVVTIMQGDSRCIFVRIRQKEDNIVITPSMVEDIEVCIGEDLRKTYAAGEVGFDYQRSLWYVTPNQEETMNLEKGHCSVKCRVKFKNANQSRKDVLGADCRKLLVIDSCSKEVL